LFGLFGGHEPDRPAKDRPVAGNGSSKGSEPPREIPPLPSDLAPGADADSKATRGGDAKEGTAAKASSARGGDDAVDEAVDDDEPKPARRSLSDFFRKRDDS
jgi:hypothetical protein